MRRIKVIKASGDNLIKQLKCVYDIFKNIKNEKIIFDFSNCEWASPLPVLAVCSYIKENKGKIINLNSNIKGYLRTVGFPSGIKTESEIRKLSYIPITFLKKTDSAVDKENLEARIYDIIYKNTGKIEGTKNAVSYPIMELVGNIFEHSNKSYGWFFAQHFSSKKLLDICIIDTGRGLAKGYKEVRNEKFTDKEAIIKAVSGYSIKKEIGRGYGIPSSVRVVCEAFEGNFVILSGNSFYYQDKNSRKIFELPDFYWQGVIIAYQIPYPKESIDISPFY